jgi:diguanylate cyclase (GGDEF)-like protein/PAS domain S-box-containing protein
VGWTRSGAIAGQKSEFRVILDKPLEFFFVGAQYWLPKVTYVILPVAISPTQVAHQSRLGEPFRPVRKYAGHAFATTMNAIVQIWISGAASVLLLYLVLQQPSAAALRWWLGASSLGLAAALLEWPGVGAPTALSGAAVLLCLCAQFGCIVCGFLPRRPRLTPQLLVLGASLLSGLLLLVVCRGAAARLALCCALPSLAGLVLFECLLYRRRGRYPWAVPSISAVLLLGIVRELLSAVTALHWLDVIPVIASALPPLLAQSGFLTCGGAAIALIFFAFHESARQFQELAEDAGQLRQLVDATDHGICQLDCGGRIEFINSAAAAILGLDGEKPPGTWIQEKLRATGEESSIRTIADFVLRPTMPVERAVALVPNPSRPSRLVEWSSSPILRDDEAVGVTLTLRDVTDREAEARFVRFRSDLLEMVARNKPVEEAAALLIDAVEERLPGSCCSVLLCDGDYFQAITSPRISEAFRDALRAVPCSRIIQTTGRKGSMALKGWEETLRTVSSKHGYAGTWAEPMISTANELLGTLALNHPELTSIEPTQSRILREGASMCALAFEHHASYQRLLHQGYHDALTGLPNRLLLADRLKQALARAERNHKNLGFLSIDLDHFKDINDGLGHDAGDLFLRQISARLSARIRTSDTLARTGGDEFTVILPDLTDPHDAGRVAEALISSLADPFDVEGHELYGEASIGIAIYPRDGADATTLQRNADRAMYRAKAQGRNLIRYYSGDETVEDRNRIDIERQLHHAIEEKSFSLFYQPQFTCDHQLDGFEALLRFQHPKLGMVPPSRFIPIAEENGLILPIGEWVLGEVCRQIREWEEKSLPPIRIAVNVSPMQLARGDFASSVARAIRSTHVRPELLEIELTEGVLMSSVPDSARQIGELARLGVRLSVDDFGTGYSCLSYLHQLPLHTLKIDRSFISRMLEPEGTRCIVEAIVTLARNLRLQTVAEGVEDLEQLRLLRAIGCDLIQGYFFSKPLSPIDAAALLWKSSMVESTAPRAISDDLAPSHRGANRQRVWTNFSRRKLD